MNRWLIWLSPLAAGFAAIFLYAVSWGDSWLFCLFLILPILFIVLVIACVIAIVRQSVRRIVVLSCALPLVLLPTLFLYGGPVRDRARFALWSFTHTIQVRNAQRNPMVLLHWDSYGSAMTTDNDVYLVSDPTNGLSGALMRQNAPVLPAWKFAVAKSWSSALQLACDPVWVSRLREGFYLITTSDCELKPSVGS